MQTAYYREYAQVQRSHWWYLARAEILQSLLRQFVRPNRQQRLLDIGCGPGGMRPMLSEFGTLVSTDFTFNALQFCLSQQLDQLIAADATRLPFRENRFDVVCAFDVIEHIENDQAAVFELHRVLRPGGVLVVTVPAFQFLWGRQDIVNQHFRRYHAGQLRRLIETAHFEVARMSYFNCLLFPGIATVRLAFHALGLNRRIPTEQVKSDFTMMQGSWLNGLLRRVFALERILLHRMNLPFGVSLLCVARKPCGGLK